MSGVLKLVQDDKIVEEVVSRSGQCSVEVDCVRSLQDDKCVEVDCVRSLQDYKFEGSGLSGFNL